jgi:hypothetical protein
MKLRFVLLLFFSFSMLSCASKPKEEVRAQRMVYGVIQQPSAEGGMYVLCANCKTSTPKTPMASPEPISFAPSSQQPAGTSQPLAVNPLDAPVSAVQPQQQVIVKPVDTSAPIAQPQQPQPIMAKPLDVPAPVAQPQQSQPIMVKPLDSSETKSQDLTEKQLDTSVQPEPTTSVVPQEPSPNQNNTELKSKADTNNNPAGEIELEKENNKVNVKETAKEVTAEPVSQPIKEVVAGEDKKAVIYFNGINVRPSKASVGTLDQISADARKVEQVAVRARMAKTGSLHERILLARARSVEVRQELINRGVSVKKLSAFYHADCCWIGDPANPTIIELK